MDGNKNTDTSGSVSDRDRQMMESFGEKKKTKKKRGEAGFFEDSHDDHKAERNQRDDDKAEKADAKQEVKEVLKDDEPSAAEKQEVYSGLAEATLDGDLREEAEAAPEGSQEEYVAVIDAALMQAIVENQPESEEDLDEAVETVIQEFELDKPAEAAPEEDEEEVPAVPTAGAGSTTPPPPPGPPRGPEIPEPEEPEETILPPVGGAAVAPTPTSPDISISPERDDKDKEDDTENWRGNRAKAGQLLLTGIVGYMIGRRGGRLRTEARLLPVQEKLEKEVKDLHNQVFDREEKIRRLAAEKFAAQPEAARTQLVERIKTRVERQRSTPERQTRPEAVHRPEAFGKFALPAAEVVRQKSVEVMSTDELLVIADRIERDGISVKEMYENGRLDAIGLRRVVKEYLEGDRFDRVLSENLKQLESFEGEPLTQQARDNQSATAQSNIPQVAAAPLHFNSYQTQVSTPPSPPPPTYPAPQQQNILAENRAAIAVGLVSAVIILLIIVLFA